MGLDMSPYLIARPCSQWIELDHLIGIIPFDQTGVGTEGGLIPADACDPGVVVCKELSLRDHFADLAAGIRIALP